MTGQASTTASSSSACTLNCWSVAGNWDESQNGGPWTQATTIPSSTDNGNTGDVILLPIATTGTNSTSTTTPSTTGNFNVGTVANPVYIKVQYTTSTPIQLNDDVPNLTIQSLDMYFPVNNQPGTNGFISPTYGYQIESDPLSSATTSGTTLTVDSGISNIAANNIVGINGTATAPLTTLNVSNLVLTNDAIYGSPNDPNSSIYIGPNPSIPSDTAAYNSVQIASGSTVNYYATTPTIDSFSKQPVGTPVTTAGAPTTTVASGGTLNLNLSNSNYLDLGGSGVVGLMSVTNSNNQTESVTYIPNSDASANGNVFTGTYVINSGVTLSASTGQANLGTASLDILSGGQLSLPYGSSQNGSTSGTFNIANAITLNGNGMGASSQGQDQGAIIAGLLTSTSTYGGNATVNFTGPVTLASNSNLASYYNTAVSYTFSKLNSGSYQLNVDPASPPTYGSAVINPAPNSTQGGGGGPTTGSTTGSTGSSATTGTSSNPTTTKSPQVPGAPDTGMALVKNNYFIPLIGSILVGIGVYIFSVLLGSKSNKKYAK